MLKSNSAFFVTLLRTCSYYLKCTIYICSFAIYACFSFILTIDLAYFCLAHTSHDLHMRVEKTEVAESEQIVRSPALTTLNDDSQGKLDSLILPLFTSRTLFISVSRFRCKFQLEDDIVCSALTTAFFWLLSTLRAVFTFENQSACQFSTLLDLHASAEFAFHLVKCTRQIDCPFAFQCYWATQSVLPMQVRLWIAVIASKSIRLFIVFFQSPFYKLRPPSIAT